MSKTIFIAGTDTGIGKTYATVTLLNALHQKGLSTIGIKPVATGADDDSHNEDALALKEASSIQLPYHFINPILFQEPVAPHIAAQNENRELSVSALIKSVKPVLEHTYDICLMEGVGGWYVPLNKTETMADFVVATKLPVILIVGIRLGCINHTLLTIKAIQSHGIELMGWIANCIDPTMQYVDENIRFLQNTLKIDFLGRIEYGQTVLDTDFYWIPRLNRGRTA